MFILGSTPDGKVIVKYTDQSGQIKTITGDSRAQVQAAYNTAITAAAASSASSGNSSSTVAKRQVTLNQLKNIKSSSGSRILSNGSKNINTVVRGTDTATSSTYYDIDFALADVKAKAASYGVNLTVPATYGKSVKSAALAQSIVDSYVAKANDLIAAKYAPVSQYSQASQSSQTTPAKNVSASAAAKTSNYYDVDAALASVYSQAQKAGVKVSKPTSYGTSVTDAKKAQSIIDAYTAAVNKQLSATTTKASTATKATAKAASATTTTYDISAAVKSLSATAKTYGVSATAPKTTSYKTQKEAQAAIDSYSSAIEKAYSTSVKAQAAKTAAAAAKNTTSDYYSGSLNSQEQQTLDKWNAREAANNTGKHYNPAYIKWYYEAPANTQSPPVYKEDAAKESAAVTAARNAANAKAEGQIADIQKELARSSALEAKGVVSHAANNANNASNMKGSNYSKGVATSGSIAASKTAPAKVITATTAKLASKVTATTAAVKSAAAPKVISAQTPKVQAGTGSTAKATSANLAKLSKQVQTTNAKVIKASDSLIRTAEIEKQGASNPNSKTAKTIYSSSAAEKAQNLADYKAMVAKGKTTSNGYLTGATTDAKYRAATSNAGYAAAVKAATIEAETAKRLNAAFKDAVDKNNKVIDAIQVKGAASTGETGVQIIRTDKNGQITAVSKTASQYGAVQKIKQEQEAKAKQATAKLLNYSTVSPMTAIDSKGNSVLIGEKASFVDLETFKTVAQKAAEVRAAADESLYKASIKNGGLGAASSKLNKKFIDTFSYKNASDKVSELNAKISPYIPTQDSIAQTRKTLLGSNSEVVGDLIKSNSITKTFADLSLDKYEYLRTKPLNAAGDVGVLLAESAIGGAALKGAQLGLSAGTLAALKPIAANSAKIAKLAPTAAKTVGAVPGLFLGADMVKSTAAYTNNFSDIYKDMETLGTLAIGFKAFGKGAEAVETKNPYLLTPGLKSGDLKETSLGSSGNTRNLHQGTTFLDVVSSDSNGRLHLGSVAPNAETLKPYINVDAINELNKLGKTSKQIKVERSVQAFDKTGERILNRYVSDVLSDADKTYYAAGKRVATAAYNAKNAVVNPEKFSILSTDVPTKMRAALTESIQSYGKESGIKSAVRSLKGGTDYKIQVAGSNAQKLQMGKYLTRTPGDLEIYVDNPTAYIQKFATAATKKGFLEDKDFKIENKGTNEPKIAFKVNGNWEKGVEVFNHNAKSSLLDVAETQDELKQGWQKQEGIAYNFGELKSLKVDGVKLMKLQEQAARKYSGSTFLKSGKSIEVAHAGRVKDVRDLVELGTSNKVVKGTGKAADVVSYTKAAAEKYPNIIDKTQSKAYSPVAEFIVKNDRLPTRAELDKLVGVTTEGEKELIYEDQGNKKGFDEIISNAGKISSAATAQNRPLRDRAAQNAENEVYRIRSGLREAGKDTHKVRESSQKSDSTLTRSLPERRIESLSNSSSSLHPSRELTATLKEISAASRAVHASATLSRAISPRASSAVRSTSATSASSKSPRSAVSKGSISVNSRASSLSRPSNLSTTVRNMLSENGSFKKATQYQPNMRGSSKGTVKRSGSSRSATASTAGKNLTSAVSKTKSNSGKSPTPVSPKIISDVSSVTKILSSLNIPKISQGVKSVTEKSTTSQSGQSLPEYSAKNSSMAFLHMRKKRKDVTDTNKKKKSQQYVKHTRSEINRNRTIFNKLGSIDTMLGSGSITASSTKKTVASPSSKSVNSNSSMSRNGSKQGSQGSKQISKALLTLPNFSPAALQGNSRGSKSAGSSTGSGNNKSASVRMANTQKSSLAYLLMRKNGDEKNSAKKKKKEVKTPVKKLVSQINKKRTIYNRLGSLDTMLG